MRTNEAKWVESRQRWQINVQDDGERRTFVDPTPGKKGKIACEKKADKWLEDKLVNENVRAEVMLNKYEDAVKKSTSTSNYYQCRSHIKIWIKPQIGTKRIGSITNADLKGIIDNAYSKGNLAEKSLKNLRGHIVSFMTYCIDSKATNIRLKKLKIPAGAKRSVKKILAPGDMEKLFSSTKTTLYCVEREDFYIHAYRFAAVTGLRPGELIGLMKGDISGNTVSIRRSINDLNETTQGKNKNAVRTFIIGPTAQSILRDQSEMLREYSGISNHIFPNRHMEHIDQEDFRRCWKRYCVHNKFENTLCPYELRHTFVSVTDEMPTGLKQPLVGHAKNFDTEGVYGKQRKDALTRAAGYVESAFSPYIGTHKSTHSD